MPAATSMWAASRMESRKATAHLRGQAAPVYEGNWKDNQRDGYGTYKWNVGDSYEGEWKDNKFNGQGTLIQTDGTKYKGGFVNGMEEGSGIQEDKNGNRYEGFFKQGKKTRSVCRNRQERKGDTKRNLQDGKAGELELKIRN